MNATGCRHPNGRTIYMYLTPSTWKHRNFWSDCFIGIWWHALGRSCGSAYGSGTLSPPLHFNNDGERRGSEVGFPEPRLLEGWAWEENRFLTNALPSCWIPTHTFQNCPSLPPTASSASVRDLSLNLLILDKGYREDGAKSWPSVPTKKLIVTYTVESSQPWTSRA